jgi:hypothetical protein
MRDCPLCDSQKRELINTQKIFKLPPISLSDQIQIYECQSCHFIFSDTLVEQSSYDNYYQSSTKYLFKNDFSELEIKRANQLVDLIDKYFSLETRIVEIGSGSACLMFCLAARGYKNLMAVDPSYDSSDIDKLPFKALLGLIGNLPKAVADAELVIYVHVLEHLFDLKQFMDELKQTFSSNISVYIEVPDAARYCDYIESPFQDFNFEHINHFSPEALQFFFERHGFKNFETSQGSIEPVRHKFVPVISAFFQRSTNKDFLEIAGNLPYPVAYKKEINLYAQRSLEYFMRIKSLIKKELLNVDQVIVWGLGQLCLKLLAEDIIPQEKIFGITDSTFNASVVSLSNKNINLLKPCDLINYDYPILIATTISQVPILKCIGDLSLKNKVITLPNYLN